MRGLDPTEKSVRAANYIVQLRKELQQLANTCGVAHPGLVRTDMLELLDEGFHARSLTEAFEYQPDWGVPRGVDLDSILNA